MTILTTANAFPGMPFPQHPTISNLDTNAAAWYSAVIAAGGNVSLPQMYLVDNLIKGLKTDGLFTILDRLWLFASDSTIQALIDVIATVTATNNGVSFTIRQGYTGDGTHHIDTGFNASTAGGNYTQNSAHLGIWYLGPGTGITGDGVISAGSNATSNTVIYTPFDGDGNIYLRINDAVSTGATVAYPGAGFYQGVRSSSTARTGYFNGSSIQNVSQASGALENSKFFVFGNAPFGINFGAKVAIACIGAAMNATQASNFYTRLNTYMSGV